jgi:hypothetical protein
MSSAVRGLTHAGIALLALGFLTTPALANDQAGPCDCSCPGYVELISQIDNRQSSTQVDQCGGSCAIAWGRCEAAWSIGHNSLPPALAVMLEDFLSGMAMNDPATMDSFWDDAMLYTGPDGHRLDKQEMIRNPHRADLPTGIGGNWQLSAADLTLQDLGSTAVISFRLIAQHGDRIISEYLNTGVFRQTDQSWRVISWQATRSGSD